VPGPGAGWRATLAAADEALYRAKAGGRNRTELAS
jgi:PleD family two-component response regulator